ncbi:PREDICTED: platelet basic protein isoform X2 [Myotis brandtii]|uniref:platelet basic protein isoform X2 n=1 Tax=Myotis brandtii TaxID=109478 RepID=UPI0003BB9CCB|nr:PREDICTED: platelet basic protein isoform X2 [Myotis brandtii]
MNLRPRATSAPVLQALLQLSLLLTVMVPSTVGERKRKLEEPEVSIRAESVEGERHAELRCMCITTTSGIHPRNFQNLKLFKAGPHCSNVEVIATLKNGKEICLDPNAPVIKKIVQKILEVSIPAASLGNEHYAELRCTCITTTSGIHPRNFQNLKLFKAGPHCSNVEVIATLKNGKEICLDPNAPMIKKIVQKILEGDESAA